MRLETLAVYRKRTTPRADEVAAAIMATGSERRNP